MSKTPSNTQSPLRTLTDEFLAIETKIKLGGGEKAIARQHAKSRLTARERLDLLVDGDTHFQELGLWAGYEMYKEAGGAPGAGVCFGSAGDIAEASGSLA